MAISQEEVDEVAERFRRSHKTRGDVSKLLFEVSQRVLDELRLSREQRQRMDRVEAHKMRLTDAEAKQSLEMKPLSPGEVSRLLAAHYGFAKDVTKDLRERGEITPEQVAVLKRGIAHTREAFRRVRRESIPLVLHPEVLDGMRVVLEGKISQVLGPRVRDYYALHGNVEGMLKRAGLIIIRAAPAHRA
jgi:hypothetical protein